MISYKYRITKYNPKYRDENGRFLQDDWTSISDIGKSFNGIMLIETEYMRIENAYVNSVKSFLRESKIVEMEISGLEIRNYRQPGFEDLANGKVYPLDMLDSLFRAALRERLWCKFKWQNKAYVHFGYDYYMFVGVNRFCPHSIAFAQEQGLFVEPFRSPHLARRSAGDLLMGDHP